MQDLTHLGAIGDIAAAGIQGVGHAHQLLRAYRRVAA